MPKPHSRDNKEIKKKKKIGKPHMTQKEEERVAGSRKQ